MKFFQSLKKNYLIFAIFIVLLGFILRSYNFTTVPRHGATFDEFAWTWLGINLIQEGVPMSWSSQPQYENREHLVYQGAAFWIVNPYLEHPPFFGLIAGSFALLNGVGDMHEVSLNTIRPLAVILGMISTALVFFFVREIYSIKLALIATLLHATIPTVVIGSRIVQNENFFIPLWLLSLFLISRYIKTRNILLRNISAITCGILIISKIPWIAAGVSIISILIFFKKYKDAVIFTLILIPFAAFYPLYGYFYDWSLFTNLMFLQLNRYDISFVNLYSLFQKPYLVDRFFTDGWIYWGWFSFLLLLVKNLKKNIILILPMLVYLIVYMAGIPDEPGHGWYRYPFYPFLIISIAIFIGEYFMKDRILTLLFFLFIGSTLFHNTWSQVFGFSYTFYRVLIIGWLFTILPIFFSSKKIVRLSNFLSYAWLLIFLVLNIWSIMIYNDQ